MTFDPTSSTITLDFEGQAIDNKIMLNISIKKGFLFGSILGGFYFTIVIGLSYLLSDFVQQTPVGLHPFTILLTIPFVIIFLIGMPAIYLVNLLRILGYNEFILSLIAGAIFILLSGLLGWFTQNVFKLIIRRN